MNRRTCYLHVRRPLFTLFSLICLSFPPLLFRFEICVTTFSILYYSRTCSKRPAKSSSLRNLGKMVAYESSDHNGSKFYLISVKEQCHEDFAFRSILC